MNLGQGPFQQFVSAAIATSDNKQVTECLDLACWACRCIWGLATKALILSRGLPEWSLCTELLINWF